MGSKCYLTTIRWTLWGVFCLRFDLPSLPFHSFFLSFCHNYYPHLIISLQSIMTYGVKSYLWSHRSSCSEVTETERAVRSCLLGLSWSCGSAVTVALNLFPQQLCFRHAKWQFLAHVIGSRETRFPVGMVRTAFKLISTNYYEPCQAVFLY